MTLDCSLCQKQYDSNLRQPVMGLCGHTICSTCFSQLISRRCPVSVRCHNIFSSFVISAPNYIYKEAIEIVTEAQTRSAASNREASTLSLADLKSESLKLFEAEQTRIRDLISTELLKKSSHEAMMTSQKLLPSCSMCMEPIAENLPMSCVDCSQGFEVVDSYVVVNNIRKAETMQMCGNCYLDSEHKHHESGTLFHYKVNTVIINKLKTLLEELISLPWPPNASKYYYQSKKLADDVILLYRMKTMAEVEEAVAKTRLEATRLMDIHRNTSLEKIETTPARGSPIVIDDCDSDPNAIIFCDENGFVRTGNTPPSTSTGKMLRRSSRKSRGLTVITNRCEVITID